MCTSLPGSSVPEVGIPHVDKLVHFLLYAVLGLLAGRALRGRPARRVPPPLLASVLLAIALFAAADEWHQRWVPGRSSDAHDWYADMAGGTIALLLAARPAARPEHLT